MHRYLLARSLVKDLEVLDISCGEGYGSALLAEVAKKVTGSDIDANIISKAEKKYKSTNLSYEVNDCRRMSFDDATFDCVVSFETIEHIEEQKDFLKEVKRVLKPGGILIISTPDTVEYSNKRNYNNPDHIKEFTLTEFHDFLNIFFENTFFWGQKFISQSWMQPVFDVETQTFSKLQIEDEKWNPMYLIAYCSDLEIETKIGMSCYGDNYSDYEFLEASAGIKSLEVQLQNASNAIENLKNQVDMARRTIEEKDIQITNARFSFNDLQQQIVNARKSIDILSNERDVLTIKYEEALERCSTLQKEILENLNDKQYIDTHKNMVAFRDKQVISTGGTIDSQSEQIAKARETIDSQAEQIAKARRTIDSQSEQIAKARETIDSQSEQIAKARGTIDSQSEQIAKARETIDSQSEQIAKARKTIRDKDIQLNDVYNLIEIQKSKLESQENQLEKLSAENQGLNVKLSSLKQENIKLAVSRENLNEIKHLIFEDDEIDIEEENILYEVERVIRELKRLEETYIFQIYNKIFKK
jgi:SAM-dependent methyltransferase